MSGDLSQDMFSDDEDDPTSSRYPFSSSRDHSFTSFSDTPTVIPSSPVRESSPESAVVPRTPLSLYPLLSNEPAVWTADLETPQRQPQVGNSTVQDNQCVDALDNSDVHLNPPSTPLTQDDEVVPLTQQVTTRRKKKRPQRRIFDKVSSDSASTSKLDERLKSSELLKMVSSHINDTGPSTSRLPSIYEQFERSMSKTTDTKSVTELVRKLRESNQPKTFEVVDINDSESARVLKSLISSERCVPDRKMQNKMMSIGESSFSELFGDDVEKKSSNTAKVGENNDFSGFSSDCLEYSQLYMSKFNDFLCQFNYETSPEMSPVNFQGFSSPTTAASQSKVETFDIFSENYIENSCIYDENQRQTPENSPDDNAPEVIYLSPVKLTVNSDFQLANNNIVKLSIDSLWQARTLFRRDEEIIENMEINELLPAQPLCNVVVDDVVDEHDNDDVDDDDDDSDIAQDSRAQKSITRQPSEEYLFSSSDESVPNNVKTISQLDNEEPDTQPLTASFDINRFLTPRNDPSSDSSLYRAKNSPTKGFKANSDDSSPDDLEDLNFDDSLIGPTQPMSPDLDKTLIQETSINEQAEIDVLEDTVVMDISEHRDFRAMDSDDDFTIPERDLQEIEYPPNFQGFTTARGSAVIISEKALKSAEKIWSEERAAADRIVKDNEFAVPASKEDKSDTPRVNEALKILTKENDASAANSKSAPPIIGFQTAQGRQVSISKKAMVKAQVAYNTTNANETTGSNLRLYTQSEPILMTDHLKKRKNLDDDNTPVGRKKPRLGSELQRRNLFTEIQDEDRYLSESMEQARIADGNIKKSAKIVDYSPQNIQPNVMSDEINASVAALLKEEEERLNGLSDKPNLGQENSRDQLKNRQSAGPTLDCVTHNIKDMQSVMKRSRSLPETVESFKSCSKPKSSSPQPESIPEDIYFDSPFSQELSLLNTSENREKRSAAILEQEKIIELKKIRREKAIKGSLLQLKESRSRISLQDMFDGHLPVKKSQHELANNHIEVSVISMDPTAALAYSFNCVDFYGELFMINHNDGIPLDDRAILIPNGEHRAGVVEFKRAFLATPGVSPTLLPNGWFENHYKWIVWKLASMDRIKSKTSVFPRFLTPDRVMSQLKYRYDREIDLCQRPALRRIFEKDDAPSRRMVLCVSKIFPPPMTAQGLYKSVSWTIEVTDGWYSVVALTDYAMADYINSGKVRVGTKLITSGAEILNLDEGRYPLDAADNVQLKIHTNSTRRARWDAKLGYQSQPGPMKFSLKSISHNGGLIGKIVVAVARVYPIIYREKTADGQFTDRNLRCEEKVAFAYEKECESRIDAVYSEARESKGELSSSELKKRVENSLPPKREVTAIAKILVVDDDCTALITLKFGAQESQSIFKENTFITVCNVMASGIRLTGLQITTSRYSTFTLAPFNPSMPYFKRVFTSLETVSKLGFQPAFSEFDTVGIVVSLGPAPYGMKNFECVNIAFQRDDTVDSPSFYLSILFWLSISEFGFTEIMKVGSIVACSNLEWRANSYRNTAIPIAYCTEKTVLTCNPRQNHLRPAFEALRARIKDIEAYVETSAAVIQAEAMKNTKSTPASRDTTPRATPSRASSSNSSTPLSHVKFSGDRLGNLRGYKGPPDFSPIYHLEKSSRVALDYRSPVDNVPKFGDNKKK